MPNSAMGMLFGLGVSANAETLAQARSAGAAAMARQDDRALIGGTLVLPAFRLLLRRAWGALHSTGSVFVHELTTEMRGPGDDACRQERQDHGDPGPLPSRVRRPRQEARDGDRSQSP